MNFELGQEIGRDQLGAAFLFVNERNETAAEKWDVVSVAPDTWQIVLATLPSAQQIKENRISELKKYLADTDYIIIKKAEGEVVECDDIIAQRRTARAEINQLEQELESIKGE